MPERDAVLVRCRATIRDGSKSFAHAARLFPADVHDAAVLLYAWCRHCDDQVDGETLGRRDVEARPSPRSERLEQLREATRRALAGEPASDPVFVAFERVVRRHQIPHRYPLELLEGFRMDVEGRRYESIEQLRTYCYHVAGTVGLMMAHVMGVVDGGSLERASDLGIALQMTNVARDVMEDARDGRVYLPLAWLSEVGVAPEAITDPGCAARVAAVTGRLLDEAERYYASATRGLPRLRFRCAWAVAVARNVYRAIGTEVRRRGPAAWDDRVVVPRWRKLVGLGSGLVDAGLAVTAGRLGASARPELEKGEPTLD